ncbi:hybrid sensor histidine kinase/response regulator [Flexibacterium corallicola]|uniref:hybrid sensor histidine kinase/response regulator n=1 Tax=Flexibacterium corallicola TaxID=3037259 RepID=UPI00286F2955|nr:PAS domain-containing hybrid sensor histidine kinase/response regulator [Pseudovibrio sp. M1P-2-3]
MLQGEVVILVSFVYMVILFLIASIGDKVTRQRDYSLKGRPLIYALSLSVYCTSWTFFGSVGNATRNGIEFFALYLGPILVYLFAIPLIRRIIRLSKTESITSVADFMSARYGKSRRVAAAVTLIAVIGMIPYIALQLKAVSLSMETIIHGSDFIEQGLFFNFFGDKAFAVALGMAVFTWFFGTRHIEATEHQHGLMLAIATEAVVKLAAFLIVGIWVIFWLFDGPGDLLSKAMANSASRGTLQWGTMGNWVAISLLSMMAILLLPRQFHVTVTENNSLQDLKKARWLFPLYLLAISIFVSPIALAGTLLMDGQITPDMFVLGLPLQQNADLIALIVFIGGLSASTAMVIVTTVALSIMISNDLVMPLILSRRSEDEIISTSAKGFSGEILNIRRMSIFLIILCGYGYYKVAEDSTALSSIGLLSFAAIAQLGPAFFGGLIWRRANARGALGAMVLGFAVWAYTLFLPTLTRGGFLDTMWLEQGLFGLAILKPEALFLSEMPPFFHGVIWSLGLNILCFILLSYSRYPRAIERLQANTFIPAQTLQFQSVNSWRSAITVGDLQSTLTRYIGEERAQRSFNTYAKKYGCSLDPYDDADASILRFTEQVLASAIGSASSRLILSLLIKRRDTNSKGALKLLDDATEAIQYNRDLLQVALEQMQQGIAVFDSDLKLICWNRQFRELLTLPQSFGQVGISLQAVIMHYVYQGEFEIEDPETEVERRLENFTGAQLTYQENLRNPEKVLEVKTSPMPQGGIVITFSDITVRVSAERALEKANETLEKRVRERTQQLTLLNQKLEEASQSTKRAYQDKTRFLAAASHDILQPLNAARLYSSTLLNQLDTGNSFKPDHLRNIGDALNSVEEIIGAVLDISRLDTAAFQPDISTFRLDSILDPLRNEFAAIAAEKSLRFTVVATNHSVRSDRLLLRRLLQNLMSNALKYTDKGGIVVGCRPRGSNKLSLEVIDSGIGIHSDHQEAIFREFHRLDDGARIAPGLGLGLSIVERVSKVLNLPIRVESLEGKGTRFSIELECAQEVPEAMSAPAIPQTLALADVKYILVIDNEPQILKGMEALLTSWGCQVSTADSEASALRMLREKNRSPDVILADYHLNDCTGLDVVSNLRRKLDRPIPAFLITADRSKEVRQSAANQLIGVLNKPLKPAALRAQLSRIKTLA